MSWRDVTRRLLAELTADGIDHPAIDRARAAVARFEAVDAQGSLFAGLAGSPSTPPPAGSRSTSQAAARSLPRARVAEVRAQIVAALAEAAHTDESLQAALGVGPNTLRPRRVELVRDGVVRDSGVRARTASGRRAIVWRLAEGHT